MGVCIGLHCYFKKAPYNTSKREELSTHNPFTFQSNGKKRPSQRAFSRFGCIAFLDRGSVRVHSTQNGTRLRPYYTALA